MRIEYKDTKATPELGDVVQLKNQEQTVVACEETKVKMLNIDANQLAPGDLKFIKAIGLTISNPDTDKPVALGVDYTPGSWGERIKDWFEKKKEVMASSSGDDEDEDDDDDSSFFSTGSGALLGSSWGHSSSGGWSSGSSSGGGFGGFGGGGFSGGGASGRF